MHTQLEFKGDRQFFSLKENSRRSFTLFSIDVITNTGYENMLATAEYKDDPKSFRLKSWLQEVDETRSYHFLEFIPDFQAKLFDG